MNLKLQLGGTTLYSGWIYSVWLKIRRVNNGPAKKGFMMAKNQLNNGYWWLNNDWFIVGTMVDH